MTRKSLLLLSVFVVGACAYAIDDSIQDVTFVTPGANNAACDVFVEGLRYRVKPPQTVNLFKSGEGLVVDCLAPGFRRKVIKVEADIEPSTAWNAANAGLGVPWDYASGAIFRYPDVVEIDFTGVPVKDAPMPAQNAEDIRHPESYDLEEFSPGRSRMNADKDAVPVEIQRRQRPVRAPIYKDQGAAFSEPANVSGGKSDVMSVVNGFGEDLNPAGSDGAGSSASPMPLIPGE